MAISGRVKLSGLHPEVKAAAEWAIGWADFYSVPVTITSGFRSWAAQQRLRTNFEQCVAAGRFPSPPDCLFPANAPGDSSHQFGLAWDSVVPTWAEPWWSDVRRLAGFEVPQNDVVHAQVPSWRRFV